MQNERSSHHVTERDCRRVHKGPVKETRKKHKKPDSLCQTLKSRKLAAARQINENKA